MDFTGVFLLLGLILLVVSIYYAVIRDNTKFYSFALASLVCTMLGIFLPGSKRHTGSYPNRRVPYIDSRRNGTYGLAGLTGLGAVGASGQDPINFLSSIFDDGSDDPRIMDGGKKRRRRR
jgi:hypothetical protein